MCVCFVVVVLYVTYHVSLLCPAHVALSSETHSLSHLQLFCLKLLYAWRDHLARDEDESTSYVLPNHMLFQISEILPREIGGVLACCNPIPILLRQQQHEVFFLVQQARESPLTSVVRGVLQLEISLHMGYDIILFITASWKCK